MPRNFQLGNSGVFSASSWLIFYALFIYNNNVTITILRYSGNSVLVKRENNKNRVVEIKNPSAHDLRNGNRNTTIIGAVDWGTFSWSCTPMYKSMAGLSGFNNGWTNLLAKYNVFREKLKPKKSFKYQRLLLSLDLSHNGFLVLEFLKILAVL